MNDRPARERLNNHDSKKALAPYVSAARRTDGRRVEVAVGKATANTTTEAESHLGRRRLPSITKDPSRSAHRQAASRESLERRESSAASAKQQPGAGDGTCRR
jgi:hypothetical protein